MSGSAMARARTRAGAQLSPTDADRLNEINILAGASAAGPPGGWCLLWLPVPTRTPPDARARRV